MSQKQKQEAWIKRIEEYQASGQKLGTWCKANNVSRHALQYWLEKTNQYPSMAPCGKTEELQKQKNSMFVQVESVAVSGNEAGSVSIKIGKACVEARAGVDIGLLSAVLKAVAETC